MKFNLPPVDEGGRRKMYVVSAINKKIYIYQKAGNIWIQYVMAQPGEFFDGLYKF